MYVTADRNGAGHWLNIGFLHEDAPDAFAQDLHLLLWEVLAGHELSYPFVRIVARHGGAIGVQANWACEVISEKAWETTTK